MLDAGDFDNMVYDEDNELVNSDSDCSNLEIYRESISYEQNSDHEFDHLDVNHSSNSSFLYSNEDNYFKSKNNIEYFSCVAYAESKKRNSHIFKGSPGLINIPSICVPSHALKLFFDRNMMENVVLHTNNFAATHNSSFKSLSVEELYRFIGCQIFIGIFRAKREKLNGFWNNDFGR